MSPILKDVALVDFDQLKDISMITLYLNLVSDLNEKVTATYVKHGKTSIKF